MRFIRLAALLSFLSVTGLAFGQVTPKRYALLIGVKQYEAAQLNQPPLQYPESDAQAIGDKLRSHGYSVTVLLGEEATRSAIQDKLADLRLQGNAEGVVVVGLFGHGVEFHGSEEAMYCPYDAGVRFVADADGKALFNEAGERQVEPDPATLVSMSDVLDALKLCKAGNKLLLADCCRNDPSAARGRAFGASVKLSDLPDKTACLFACSTGEKAYEHEDWNHGAMTKALLDNFSKLEAPDSDILEIAGRMSRSIDSMVRSTTAGQKRQTLNPIVKGIVELKLGTKGLLEFYEKQGYLDKLSVYPSKPAPPLPPLKYIEGEPVNELKRGRMYVVNSFASWCDPCVLSIAAMSRLQAKYPQVTFIDIDVDSVKDLEDFLKNAKSLPINKDDTEELKQEKLAFNKWWKGKVGYRFCADPSAEGMTEGRFIAEWQNPAMEDGIPTAFVVNDDGRIAWIGRPRDLEKVGVLDAVVGGTFDLTKARSEYLQVKGAEAFLAKIGKLANEKSFDAAKRLLDVALRNTDIQEERLQLRMVGLSLEQLIEEDSGKLASSYQSLLQEFESNPAICNQIAWDAYLRFVDKKLTSKAVLRKAADVLQNHLKSFQSAERPNMLDTVARIEFELGNLETALEIQTEAVNLGSADKELNKSMNEFLEKIRNERKK